MKQGLFVLLLVGMLGFCPTPHAYGQENSAADADILVQGTKTGTPVEQTTGGVTIIDEATIRNMRVETVAQVLRQVEGVDVAQLGGAGGQTSVFIRGANSSDTLVLIDGVKVNSPTTGAFDFAHLTVDQIERIEILRGTQSPLYGSDAGAGVINIITKQGRETDHDSLTVEGGSYRTWRGVLSHSKTGPVWDRAFSISRWITQGISRADEDLGNTEPDGYANTTFATKFRRGVGVGGKADLSVRLTDATSDLDDFPPPTFQFADFPVKQWNKEAVVGLTISSLFNPWWDHQLTIGWSRDHATTTGASFGDSDIDAQSRHLDWQHTLGVGPDNLLTMGYEYENQLAGISSAGEHRVVTNAFYFQDQLAAFNPLFITLGGRTDDNNQFGRHNTYKAGASLKPAGWRSRLFGNYGTGFRAPSLNDLYFPSFSNPNLRPEESSGYEVGLGVDALPQILTVETIYFRTHYDDLIAADSSFVPNNVENAEAEGVEVSGDLRGPKACIQGTYTYTATRDGSTNDLLLRRPRNKAGVSLIFEPEQHTNLRVDARYVGERLDFGSTLPSYFLVNLAASQQWRANIEAFVRVDNLFDRDYEEVTGYGTTGRSLYAGVTAKF